VTKIKRLEDVRPGDIFLGPIGGLAGVGVRLGQLVVDGGWRVGPLDVRHIGVVVQASYRESEGAAWPTGVIHAPRMVQAMPGGAEVINMTYDKHWDNRCAFARIPEDYPGQAEDAAAIALLMAEARIPYSWASYAALAAYRYGLRAPRLTEWIGRRRAPVTIPGPVGTLRSPWAVSLPCEAICSVLADQAWSLAGKRIMVGTAPQAVTPSQLGQRLLTGMEGVIWGFPSVNPLLGQPESGGADFLFS
jgi:hypothetical protein